MSKRTYRHVLVLPSQCLLHPAADDDFVICQNARRTYASVTKLTAVHPAADNLVICQNTNMDIGLCYQVDV